MLKILENTLSIQTNIEPYIHIPQISDIHQLGKDITILAKKNTKLFQQLNEAAQILAGDYNQLVSSVAHNLESEAEKEVRTFVDIDEVFPHKKPFNNKPTDILNIKLQEVDVLQAKVRKLLNEKAICDAVQQRLLERGELIETSKAPNLYRFSQYKSPIIAIIHDKNLPLQEKLTLIEQLALKDALGRPSNNLEKTLGNPSTDSVNTRSPLIHAVEKKELEIVSLLLNLGADINAKHTTGLSIYKRRQFYDYHCNGDKTTALHEAVKTDFPEMVSLLLAHQADVSLYNVEGKTPLHFAKSRACAQLLLQAGANIEALEKHGNSPLNEACCRTFETPAFTWDDKEAYQNKVDGHFDLIQCLVENHAQVNSQNLFGYSPLHNAVQVSDKTRADYAYVKRLVTYLCQQGALVNLSSEATNAPTEYHFDRFSYDPTPKMTAVLMIYDGRNTSIFNKNHKENLEVLKILHQFGASLTCCDGEGHTLLHKMIVANDTLGIAYLEDIELIHNLVSYQRDRYAPTALHTALYRRVMSSSSSDDIIKTLLKYEPDPNAIYYYGRDSIAMTPLEYGRYATKVFKTPLPESTQQLVKNFSDTKQMTEKTSFNAKSYPGIFKAAEMSKKRETPKQDTLLGAKPGFLIGKRF